METYKIRKTSNGSGNIIIADERRGLYAFYSPNYTFLSWTTLEMWQRAKGWGGGLFRKNLMHDPFPRKWIVNNVGVSFYPKNHPRYGVVKRESIDENGSRRSVCLNSAITLKRGERVVFRNSFDIYKGQRFWEKVQNSFVEALQYAASEADPEACIDAFGVDSDGYLVAYRYRCTRTDCQCVGSWWVGDEKQIFKTYNI